MAKRKRASDDVMMDVIEALEGTGIRIAGFVLSERAMAELRDSRTKLCGRCVAAEPTACCGVPIAKEVSNGKA